MALALLTFSASAWGARAAAGAIVARLGEGLGRLPVPDSGGGGESVWLNGLHFHLQVTHHEAAPAQVVEELQRRCEEQVAARSDAPSGLLERLWLRSLGAWTEASAAGVSVLCASSPADSLPVAEGLEQLLQSGDISEWLDLELAWLQPGTGGGTRELRVEPQGALDLLSAFPQQGDAPGFDPPEVKRLPDSRRLLSGAVGAHGVWTFEHANGGALEIVEAYRQSLAAAGYQPDPRSQGPEPLLLFWRHTTPLMLVVEEHVESPTTAVLLRGPWAVGEPNL